MIKRASAVFAAAMLALSGCSGEDGEPGAPGADGKDGTSCTVASNGDGTTTITCTDGTTATIEDGKDGTNGADGQSCLLSSNADGTSTLTCPDGSTIVLPGVTVAAGKVVVSDPVATVDGADVVVTANVTLNGVASNVFTNKLDSYRYAGATSATAIRTSIAATGYSVVASNGVYTLRVPGAAALVGTTPTTFMFRLNAGELVPAATIVAHLNGKPKSTVSDQACYNCHGLNVFWAEGEHHDANPQGAGACVVCHTRANSSETRLGTASTVSSTTGAITATGTAPGTRLMGYVHGIHNSHNMPAGNVTAASIDPDGSNGPLPAVTGPFTVAKPEGVYARNGSLNFVDGSYPTAPVAKLASTFSIGFPSYMNNCSTCHDTQENLDLVLAKPVTYQTCISCHDGWNGFGVANTGTPEAPVYAFGGVNHNSFGPATNCAACHDGGLAPATVGDFHGKRQAYTERNGLLYDGKDQSIVQGKRIAMTVDSVSYDASTPANLVVTWSATLDGNPVNPCNTDVAAGPIFMDVNAANSATGLSTSNLSFLQAYAQGNDWVSADIGTSPGQPVTSPTLRTADFQPATGALQPANTTCASNVATSTFPAVTTTATKGVLGLQGKPQVTFTSTTSAGAPYTRVIQVRSPSPTREFVVGTGAEPAGTDKRRAIADTAKCLTCHQGSLYQHGGNRVDSVNLCVICHNPASNEKNVRVNMGVDTAEAYDGKPGQTYDLRYMLHAVHSAGTTNAPYIVYRTNGIYAFGSEAAIAALPNWPGAGCFDVYGSTESATSGAASTGTQCGTPAPAAGPGIPAKKTHNEIVVHYPRALNDCSACHVNDDGTVALPSTSQAVAVTTYDAGASPWGNQLDDVLMSPATASCMSCHQSGDVATQAGLRAHAFQNSWTPTVFTGGRADILGGGASESCLICHGADRVSDFNAKHGE
jgi:OmcA/MtrC family decaheme c-type cytochrome